jgi:hypothetical protein
MVLLLPLLPLLLCRLVFAPQVAKFIPRGVILQYLGAQREIFIESPAAAALSQYMPSPKASESSRIVKSPMTGHLVQVGVTGIRARLCVVAESLSAHQISLGNTPCIT